MSTGLLCHKMGRLQLCKLLTLIQAIPTYVCSFLFSVFGFFVFCFALMFLFTSRATPAPARNHALHPSFFLSSHIIFMSKVSQLPWFMLFTPSVPQPWAFQLQNWLSFFFFLRCWQHTESLAVARTAAFLHLLPRRLVLQITVMLCPSLCLSGAKFLLSECRSQHPPLQLHHLWCQWLPILWPESPCHSRTLLDYDVD